MLGDKQCFYIIDKANDGTELALTVAKTDKYAPKNTGVFNVYSDIHAPGAVTQMWRYSAEEKAIYSAYFPDKVISEGSNANLFMYPQKDIKNQKFQIDSTNAKVYNEFTDHSVTLGKQESQDNTGDAMAWNVIMAQTSVIFPEKQRWAFKDCAPNTPGQTPTANWQVAQAQKEALEMAKTQSEIADQVRKIQAQAQASLNEASEALTKKAAVAVQAPPAPVAPVAPAKAPEAPAALAAPAAAPVAAPVAPVALEPVKAVVEKKTTIKVGNDDVDDEVEEEKEEDDTQTQHRDESGEVPTVVAAKNLIAKLTA